MATEKIVVRAGKVAAKGTYWEQQIKSAKKYFREMLDGHIRLKVCLGGIKDDEKALVRQCLDGSYLNDRRIERYTRN